MYNVIWTLNSNDNIKFEDLMFQLTNKTWIDTDYSHNKAVNSSTIQ